jgi:hypothetical protein
MSSLAEATGSLGDVDSDGVYDEPLVYFVSATDVNDAIIDGVTAIGDFATTYDEVVLRASSDKFGLVDSVTPSSYTEVDVSSTSSLSFEVSFTGNLPATDEAYTYEFDMDLVGDGVVIETRTVVFEVPPAD